MQSSIFEIKSRINKVMTFYSDPNSYPNTPPLFNEFKFEIVNDLSEDNQIQL